MRGHDVRTVVTRAGRVSPRGWKSLADHLGDLLAREGRLPDAGPARAPAEIPADATADAPARP
ncbi:hypothetical protein MTF65_29310 [Streptomyces sp. APSN-46.1]|uniref:hypothetical protein n=1 Tax=Streptomyces sp. APSN-46.1 TaxID=2929049 RepID=UPI001FB43D20|nr:hypothetical protein [Streptomyces sp. APSN-46.1]MCJ1681382.1 hypothetical protein [Streptomyces sp. APSN-46.1]